MPDLRIAGLVKRYGQVEALRGIDLEVRSGEFFVLLGPSAAGKTTTLRSIAGLEKPDAGRIVFEGRDITHAPVQGRTMSMIFQTFALYPHLSVRDNLAYPLREARLDRREIQRRVDETAEQLRIRHTLARRPSTLSGGEQQRVAIGRALIRRPRLLLLDEPLTNLDAKLRHDTRAEFKRLHRDLGMTMVYATPDQLEALSMGERVAVLNHGRVVQTDTPERLFAAPASNYVATLVGAPPMNLVAARLAGDGRRLIRLPFAELEPGRLTERLEGTPPGTEFLFGIRPTDLSPVKGEKRGPAFAAVVHMTEPLGDTTILDVEANGQILKMVLPEEEALACPVGSTIEVQIAMADIHLFYKDTGVAVA